MNALVIQRITEKNLLNVMSINRGEINKKFSENMCYNIMNNAI